MIKQNNNILIIKKLNIKVIYNVNINHIVIHVIEKNIYVCIVMNTYEHLKNKYTQYNILIYMEFFVFMYSYVIYFKLKV